jgi:regulatory subunit for Cdc7p protein kinase
MAAAVFIPPSPHDPLARMSTATRRAPLASIPNATNSPHRLLTTSGSKRSRAQANVSLQENEPPYKRQALEKTATERGPCPSTPTRQMPHIPGEGRVFERGHGTSGSTAFQRKLVAARDKNSGLKVTKPIDPQPPPPNDDNIRQWQKHYRKIFPTFHFYFDGVPDDVKARFVRRIVSLGAVCHQPICSRLNC